MAPMARTNWMRRRLVSRPPCPQLPRRLDVCGAALLFAILVASLALVAPRAQANKNARNQPAEASRYHLPKSFKGKLPITELTEDEATLQALDRLAYGPRPGDVERIRRMGLEKWVDQQLDYDSLDDSAVKARLGQFKTLRMSSKELLEKYPPPFLAAKRAGLTPKEYFDQLRKQLEAKRKELQAEGVAPARIQIDTMPGPQRIVAELDMATMDRAIYSNRQLHEVMCNFWLNHFNVNANKGLDRWLLASYVRDTIRPRAMGKFEDLLVATAKSPAMLFYLDNWLSADPAAFAQMQKELAARRRRFEGMFAGVAPPPPGTFPQPGGFPPRPLLRKPPKPQERGLNENYGREIMELHTLGVDGGYTQQDVIQVAKCLTGWTIRAPRRDAQFFFDGRIHAEGAKVVLGKTIDSGGMKDGEIVLHLLATSPATAHHLSFELAQYFVSDTPPEALVDRMAKTYLSTNGDIRSVLHTMIYSPEFWSREAYRAKIKTPFELAVSAARALNVDAAEPLALAQWVARMGQPLYLCEPPTGYSNTAETWVNAGGLLNRMNFALALATDHVPGVNANLGQLFGPDAAANPKLALSRALGDFLDGQVSAQTRDTLEKQLGDPQILQAKLDDPVRQVNEGLIAGLVLGAPEFQRR